MTTVAGRPRPFVVPAYCKGCGRCIGACVKNCFATGTEINPATGLVPAVLDLTDCNGCGLCVDACPEPHGLHLRDATFDAVGPGAPSGPGRLRSPVPSRGPTPWWGCPSASRS